MLLLMLKAGGRPYGLDSRNIVEVLPYVPLDQPPSGRLPQLCFHGQSIAVLDLTEHYFGSSVRRVLTTRIVVVSFSTPSLSSKLGLVAEAVTETRQVRGQHVRVPENDAAHGAPAQAWRSEEGQDYAILDLAAIVDAVASKNGAPVS